MSRPVLRYANWQSRTLWTVGLALLLSGATWLAIHYTLGAGADELPHPLEAWSMRLHGAAMFGALFALGFVCANHVPAGWRVTDPRLHRRGDVRRTQRWTGLALLGLAGFQVLSAYTLYYLISEDWRPLLGWLHAGAGAGMAILVLLHRRSRPRVARH